MNRFRDRADAGRSLARLLAEFDQRPDAVVLALPRGGVPVAYEVARILGLPLDVLLGTPTEKLGAHERAERELRERLYRGARPPRQVVDERVILVDDGLATGATMHSAVAGLRLLLPRSITVAVPVGSQRACEDLALAADRVVCALTPEPFQSVGAWYDDFQPTTDEEVRELLRRGRAPAFRGLPS